MRKHLVNVSPWVLASACLLLAIIIGSFAANNYSREKQLMEAALVQKGESVLRFINSGIRVSFRGFMMGGQAVRFNWNEHVQGVIDQAMDDENILLIEFIDESGVVLAAGNPERIGDNVIPENRSFLQSGGQGRTSFRMHHDSNGERIGFQIAQSYEPRPFRNMPHRGMHGRGKDGQPRGIADSEGLQDEFDRLRGQRYTLLVELDVQQYNSALRNQVVQIVVLSVVLLLVGIGGWLSLMTLQGLKGSQLSLKQVSEFNDILIESLPVGLIATDSEGIIQIVNDAAEDILGLDSGSIIGTLPVKSLPGEICGYLTMAEAGGPLNSIEERIVTQGEREQFFLLTGVKVAEGQGGQVGSLLLMQDVTQQRGLESKLRRTERLAALGKMAAGVAHELRNPLSSIKGLAVVLKTKLSDEDDRNTADVLVNEVERLNRSIGELLDYARPEKLELEPVLLRQVAANTLDLIQPDAEQQGVRINLEVEESSDWVLADEDKLKQVLLNMLLNSLQAIDGAGNIDVGVTEDDENVVCTVTDTGKGIAQEDLMRIFDPYFTTKSDGTGLGLAISAKIVEEHGGSISAESRQGEGTTVAIRLPKYAREELS